MKFRAIVEYEYPIEHKPPVKAELILHGDRVVTDNIKWIEQEPKTGHWIMTPKAVMGEGYMWYCDKCEYQVYQDSSRDYPSEKYCPNCGADMREVKA